MLTHVKKLWDNKVSLRSNVVNAAIFKREDLEVRFNGNHMVLTPKELIFNGHKNKEQFWSEFDKCAYYLIDYDWKPLQDELFKIL